MIPITLQASYLKLKRLLRRKPQVLVLYYHRVLPQIKWGDPFLLQVTQANFENHLAYLRRTYPVISLAHFIQQIQAGYLEQKDQVVITFDDGYRDNYLYAYPLLKKWNLPATIFVATDYVETQNLFFWEQLQYLFRDIDRNRAKWDIPECQWSFSFLETEEQRLFALSQIHQTLKKLPPPQIFEILTAMNRRNDAWHSSKIAEEDLPLTWEQLREMQQATISVGAHTCTHPVLTSLPLEEAEREIRHSKRILEEHLQQEVRFFAYPYGKPEDVHAVVCALVKNQAFLCACSTVFGTNDLTCDPFAIKRVVIRNWDVTTLARKIAHVFRSMEWIL